MSLTNETNEQMAQRLEVLAKSWNTVADSWSTESTEMEALCRKEAADILAGAAALRQVDALAAEGARLQLTLQRGKCLAIESLDPLWSKNNRFTDAEDELYTWCDSEVSSVLTDDTPATAAWLQAHDAEVTAQERNANTDIIRSLHPELCDFFFDIGDSDYLRGWLQAHDAEVRRAALEEAANVIQQTTPYGGDANGADYGAYQGRLYAMEQIKALSTPKDLLSEDAAQPAEEGVSIRKLGEDCWEWSRKPTKEGRE